MAGRHWTAEEVGYLEAKWGKYAAATIADHLGRSEQAILRKAYKLRLGPQMDAGGTMSARELLTALGYRDGSSSYTYILRRLADAGLPVLVRPRGRMTYYRIQLDSFWRWAEQHQDKLSFARFEEGALGVEPDWARAKRARDARKPQNHYAAWTAHEDALLTTLLGQYSHTTRELARIFRRTPAAVIGRIDALGLKQRPIPERIARWTREQEAELMRMRAEGYSFAAVAEALGRSEGGCRNKCGKRMARKDDAK